MIIGTKGIRGRVSFDTLDRHLDRYSIDILIDARSTYRSMRDRHSVDTRSTLDQQSDDSQPSVDQLICIDQNLVDSQPTADQDVDGVSIKCQQRC